MSVHFDFEYFEPPTIPDGMTVAEWRNAGRPTFPPPLVSAASDDEAPPSVTRRRGHRLSRLARVFAR